MGNLNASLFATEGIASVGPGWAPLAALICGLILSLGNLVSGRLPPQLVATSAGLVLQALFNVSLSTVLLSDGMATLFLLWFVTPDMPAASPEMGRCRASANQRLSDNTKEAAG